MQGALRRTALRARPATQHASVHRRWESGSDSAGTQPAHNPGADSQWRTLRRKLRHLHETEGVDADDPHCQQELRAIFEKPKAGSLSAPELRRREEELIKGALRAVEQNNALEKRKLETELDKARRAAVQMQQQLDAMRQAEHLHNKGMRKPQHRHKFQVEHLDKTYVWHQMLNHASLGNQNPLLIVEGFGNRVWDANGKEYLDATSGGTWTVNVGYAHGNRRVCVCRS